MEQDSVLYEASEGVALLTINRPAKLNALDYATVDRLLDLLDRIEDDPAVRVAILTGAGDRAFSAGADIAGFAPSVAAGAERALKDFLRRGQRLTSRIESLRKPVIAAVNGLAYGGGCEITEAAPLAIASDRARFAKSEIDIGLMPTFGGTQRLPRLVGRKRALKMILTGEPITAEEAQSLGLVNAVAPHVRLLDEARALARTLLEKPPLAVAACLASVTRGLNMSIDEGLAIEAAEFARLVPTQDIREGIDAFLEKRRPQFAGR